MMAGDSASRCWPAQSVGVCAGSCGRSDDGYLAAADNEDPPSGSICRCILLRLQLPLLMELLALSLSPALIATRLLLLEETPSAVATDTTPSIAAAGESVGREMERRSDNGRRLLLGQQQAPASPSPAAGLSVASSTPSG